MTSQNLAIVLAPSLLWSPVFENLASALPNPFLFPFYLQVNNGDALSLNMSLANTHAAVIEHLIMFADRFFPGEVIAL
jgi:hypothetical protein